MEESKELQGFYKIFRAVIYISVLMEFFEYAIDPRAIDGFGGVVCDLHDRIKQWFIYHDGNLVYSKVVTFLLVCITCVGTRNKKHLEFDARKQVLYPLVSGVLLLVLSVWIFGYAMDTRLYALRLNIILYMVTTIIGTVLVCLFLNKVDTLKSTIMKKKEEQLQISLDRVKLQKHVYELCRVQKLTINEVRKKTGLGMGTIYRYLHTFEEENPKLVEQMKKQGPNIIPEDYKKLQEEVLRLKCELKRERLRADFYEEMVAFGKEVYGIDLKKAGTK